ncbi:MAG: (2Fe-2S)-binding protein [Methylococcales bacterium]|nr:(2Fe-2S)-binding protein [Methylococcales bacterium]
MYVCLCQAVTDRDIQQAAKNGATSLKDLRRQLGVTVDCGRCARFASKCLKTANESFAVSDQAA